MEKGRTTISIPEGQLPEPFDREQALSKGMIFYEVRLNDSEVWESGYYRRDREWIPMWKCGSLEHAESDAELKNRIARKSYESRKEYAKASKEISMMLRKAERRRRH